VFGSSPRGSQLLLGLLEDYMLSGFKAGYNAAKDKQAEDSEFESLVYQASLLPLKFTGVVTPMPTEEFLLSLEGSFITRLWKRIVKGGR
jgi:hypothetical protein